MNHEQMDAADVRSRYVMRRLSSDEEQAFEDHLLDCAECQDEVEREVDLRDGLRRVPQLRGLPRGVRDRPTLAMPLLAAAAAVLLVVSATLAITLRRTVSELRATEAAAGELERRAASADDSARTLATRLAAAERLAATAEKSASAAIVFLTTARGAAGDDAAVNRVTISAGITSVVFSIDLGRPAGSAEYTAAVADAAGAEIWRGGPFHPYSQEALAVTMDAALLHDGDYVISLERRAPGGGVSAVTHRLHVARQR